MPILLFFLDEEETYTRVCSKWREEISEVAVFLHYNADILSGLQKVKVTRFQVHPSPRSRVTHRHLLKTVSDDDGDFPQVLR